MAVRKLVFGCGYLGQRIAQRWQAAGDEVWVVTRRADAAATWRAAGWQTIVADIAEPTSLSNLPPAEVVLFAVGFDRNPGQSVHDVYVHGFRHVLAALPRSVRKLLYISSTGVYGTADGDWVNEQTMCHPQRESARACCDAESLLQQSEFGERCIIFRCAGIYGPGRVPHRVPLLAGEPLTVPPDGFLNLIHVDDAAEIVLAAERVVTTPETLNVSDGHPVVRREYYAEVARLLGAAPPQFVAAPTESPARRRAAADKRIDNRRLLELVRPQFRYPTYREGLAAILRLEQAEEPASSPPSPR